jgi:hypothetical protein
MLISTYWIAARGLSSVAEFMRLMLKYGKLVGGSRQVVLLRTLSVQW